MCVCVCVCVCIIEKHENQSVYSIMNLSHSFTGLFRLSSKY